MSLGRYMCAAVSLSGSILVAGGYDGRASVDTTEALSLETMTFAAVPTMLTKRRGCAALVLLQDHSPRCALVVGGYDNRLFSPATTEVLTAAG